MSSDFDLDEYQRVDGITLRAELAICAIANGSLVVLMMEREAEPFKGWLALPGGYLRGDRDLDATAHVILAQLGMYPCEPRLVGVCSKPGRDPKARGVSATYAAIVELDDLEVRLEQDKRFRIVTAIQANDDICDLSLEGHPVAAGYDHAAMIAKAIAYLRQMLENSLIAFEFLPPAFTLLELQQVHEVILGEAVDKVRFRKRMLARIFPDGSRLRATGREKLTGGRPAKLFELQRN
ncbi:ADP-ribose pyrophosphatase [Novosphingobium marinum]|uniref:8-oxo-dGTP diphosphatase n=1 Tax=Novosphingobium marinum TaxID=1514948 RepID=A0A7Y9XWR3_9SPHN|nr:NUDIX hydrolase [Novosphingobium marinum]NYH95972.1 8-oxo-dGTP diphosphatase [Novosphingobium marinum]GGC31471.1 ADP-ribose pyrophosphatase [Novosphingobium marinum]